MPAAPTAMPIGVVTASQGNRTVPNVGALSGASLFVTAVLLPGGKQEIPISGTSFYVYSANAPVNVRPLGGVDNPYVQGTGLNLKPANAFTQLSIANNNNVAINVIIFVGFDRFDDRRVILSAGASNVSIPFANAAVTNVGSDKVTIAGNATDVYNGLGQAGPRKQIVVTNLSAAASLNILDSAGNIFATVFPQSAWTVESSDGFQVQNPTGNAIAYNVGETFYQS